jgi:hypothetical protein
MPTSYENSPSARPDWEAQIELHNSAWLSPPEKSRGPARGHRPRTASRLHSPPQPSSLTSKCSAPSSDLSTGSLPRELPRAASGGRGLPRAGGVGRALPRAGGGGGRGLPRAGGGVRCASHALTGKAGVAPRQRHGDVRARPCRRAWRRYSSRRRLVSPAAAPEHAPDLTATETCLGDGVRAAGGWPGRRWPRCWRLAWATAASLLAWRRWPRLSPAPDGRPAVEPSSRTRLLLYFLLRT